MSKVTHCGAVYKRSHGNAALEVDYELVKCIFMNCFLKDNIKVIGLVALLRTN